MGILRSVELPIQAGSKILSSFTHIGGIRVAYKGKFDILKYVFVDPVDGKLKAKNPLDDLPVVKDAYITVQGDSEDLKQFIRDTAE